MLEKLGSFALNYNSKKLIVLLAFDIAAVCMGYIEAAERVTMAYLGVQGGVDVMKAFRNKNGGK